MNLEIKQKWVDALRSGKYKQGKKALCSLNKNGEKTHCCLGVLCEVLGLEPEYDGSSILSYGGGERAYLPKEARDLSGLDSCGSLNKPVPAKQDSIFSTTTLTALNDNGFSFEEIANVIQEQF